MFIRHFHVCIQLLEFAALDRGRVVTINVRTSVPTPLLYLLQNKICLNCFRFRVETQQAHDVNTTSPQRRCNVMTLHRR